MPTGLTPSSFRQTARNVNESPLHSGHGVIWIDPGEISKCAISSTVHPALMFNPVVVARIVIAAFS